MWEGNYISSEGDIIKYVSGRPFLSFSGYVVFIAKIYTFTQDIYLEFRSTLWWCSKAAWGPKVKFAEEIQSRIS